MTPHDESHRIESIGWLRAAVLGANDGIVSTASLLVGVASAGQDRAALIVTGIAGLVAGAMSMAAGEYVSVSSQTDAEAADRDREARELATQPDVEREELIQIYMARGLARPLAVQVAEELTRTDALKAHLRDELGLAETNSARPVQAAVASAAAFAGGAALPLAVAAMAPASALTLALTITSLLFLALLGGLGAAAGGAPVPRAVIRVTFWGAFAMAVTAAIGSLFGTGVV
ncbi:MAG: VIT family protein [Sphingopyxis sp.]|nr:VIT family protein [Sphingopyxis sp.]